MTFSFVRFLRHETQHSFDSVLSRNGNLKKVHIGVFSCRQTPRHSSVSLLRLSPLVVFNSLSSMRLRLRQSRHDNTATQRSSSYCLDYTGCHLSSHSVVSNSLLWRSGGCSNPPACTHRSCLGHWSYLFSSDILSLLYSVPCLQPVSWLSVSSPKHLNGTAV